MYLNDDNNSSFHSEYPENNPAMTNISNIGGGERIGVLGGNNR